MVWMERSIRYVGHLPDLYTYVEGDEIRSTEPHINEKVETPLSQSNTWNKITSGRTSTLSAEDKNTLVELVRHLHIRNPGNLEFIERKVSEFKKGVMDADITSEEMEMYHFLTSREGAGRQMFAETAAMRLLHSSMPTAVAVMQSPQRAFRTSDMPVAPGPQVPRGPHEPVRWGNKLTEGMSLCLPLSPHAMAVMHYAEFSDRDFLINEAPDDYIMYMNRWRIRQFRETQEVSVLICDDCDLVTDMQWAQYEVVKRTPSSITFRPAW